MIINELLILLGLVMIMINYGKGVPEIICDTFEIAIMVMMLMIVMTLMMTDYND